MCRTVLLLLLACSTIAFAEEGAVHRDGFQLHYTTTGSGKPLVFLSGGPGSDVDYLKPAAQLFPSNFQFVFLEQRGTGRSVPSEINAHNMTLRLVVEDLEALREGMKQERLFLVGHSWGGMLAMAYAAAHPDRVDGLILIASGGPTLEFERWFGDEIETRLFPEDKAARDRWSNELRQNRIDEDKGMLENFKAILPAYFFDRRKALAAAGEFKDGSLHAKPANLLNSDMSKEYDSRPGLKNLDRPVLIVQGYQDPVGQKTAEDIHACIRSSTLQYIRQCGHLPWLEKPEVFRKIIAGFLTTNFGSKPDR